MSFLKAVDPESQAKERDNFARGLEEIANEIRRTEAVPNGCFLFLFRGDGSVRRVKKIGDFCNLFEVIGALEMGKKELLDFILSRVHAAPVFDPPKGPLT